MSDTLDLDLDFDVEISEDVEPEVATPKGRTPVLDRLIWKADELPTKAKAKGQPPVTPWVIYPAPDKDGVRQPIVSDQQRYTLLKKYGKGSEYHLSQGHYFEITFDARTAVMKESTGAKKSKTKHGVLFIRKVEQAPDGTASED